MSGLPDLPVFSEVTWVNEERNLTSEASLYHDDMSQTLVKAIDLLNLMVNSRIIPDGENNQGEVVNDGFKIPNKTTAEINNLEENSALGTLWFDVDINKLKVKTAPGVIETITSS